MENNLRFNSSICTSRSQSERLLALGLKKETADMHHYQYIEGGRWNIEARPSIAGYNNRLVPAWSLHRLIEMIPIAIPDASGITHYFTTDGASNVSYYYFGEECWEIWKSWNKKALYDNIIDCIEWLISIKQFNKEYLEE
jgi:hypothetical protein